VQPATGSGSYADAQLTFAPASHYTYVIFGGGLSVVTLSLLDDIGDAASGEFSLRGVNVATGIGPVDVYRLAPGATLEGSAPVLTGLAYGVSGSFTQFPTGTYDLVVTPAGGKDPIYDPGAQVIAENAKISLLVYTAGSGQLANAALLFNDGTTTFVDNTEARFKFVSVAA
jgi:hypothetical protein